MNRSLTRDRLTIIMQGILCLVLFVVVLQLWLLTATLNAWQGGEDSVLWPAAAASVVCCLANVSLLRYLRRLERRRASRESVDEAA